MVLPANGVQPTYSRVRFVARPLVEYFSDDSCPERDAAMSTLAALQRDPDKDVRYFSGAPDELEFTYGLEVVPESEDEMQLSNCTSSGGSTGFSYETLHGGNDPAHFEANEESGTLSAAATAISPDSGSENVHVNSDAVEADERCDGTVDADGGDEGPSDQLLVSKAVGKMTEAGSAGSLAPTSEGMTS